MKLAKEEREPMPRRGADHDVEIQALKDTCDALEAEISGLKADLDASRKVNRAVLDVTNIDEGQLYSEIARLHNEIISLREPMSCGDPKAYWISTIPVLPPELQIGPIVTDQTKPSGYCTACERRNLEVAAAVPSRERLAKILFELDNKKGDAPWPDDFERQPYCEWALRDADKILALLPLSDRSALDAYVQERVDAALPDRNLVRSALYELMGYLGISYLSDQAIEAVYSRLAANRAKVGNP